MPTNQEYNRCLKEIGRITNFDILLKTHKARFFFANEVTYNNGVPLKTVSRMLGHTSVRTTEVYVRSNKKNISDQMDIVGEMLFSQNGRFKNEEFPGEGNEDV